MLLAAIGDTLAVIHIAGRARSVLHVGKMQMSAWAPGSGSTSLCCRECYTAATWSLTTGKTLAYLGHAGASSSLLTEMKLFPTSPVHRLPCSAAARSFVFEGPDIVAA